MGDRLKNILNQVIEWWNGFDAKRKMILISTVAVAVLTLAILSWVLTKPTKKTLVVCESTAEASEIVKLLDADSISSFVSDDGLIIEVNSKDLSSARLVLGSNGYPAAGYDLDQVFAGGFSSTETDKTKKYQAYLESQIANDLTTMDVVKSATVRLNIPVDESTIISKDLDTYASVTLTLNSEIDDEVAAAIAKFISTAVGNKDTANITILDSKAKLLYSGEETDATGISAATLATAKEKQETEIKKKVRSIMQDTYDTASVAPNLKLENANKIEESTEYAPPEGQDQGLVESESGYESETIGGTGGIVGTDANDETGYMMEDGNGTSSTVSEFSRNYKNNETHTRTEEAAGSVILDESSIAVVVTNYVYYDEAELERQGVLDNMTFDEFTTQNREKVKTDVDDDLYQAVAAATGIALDRIAIIAYDVPFFMPKEASSLPYSTIFTIVMGIVVLALLAFVVFKGTRPIIVEEEQPELPVDEMLATVKDELGDIDYNDKSEARILIEKFVDEKPEAVAQLLRNWLNEDWE